MQLFVVRHGETEENASGVIQGHHDGTLSARGREQARRLAIRLKEVTFDAIYSSDLGRALRTAEAIAQHQRAPITATALLRERGAGVFQGRSFQEMDRVQQASGLSHTEFRPQGGESYRDVQARVLQFLESLKEHSDNQKLLIVSHGRWMRMLLSFALNLEIDQALTITQSNTGVNIFEYHPASGFVVRTLNCTLHFDSPLTAK
jgi:broad specificity phosphatase PhoE